MFDNFDNFDSGHFPRKYAASGQGGALPQTPILDNFDNFDKFDNFDSGHFPRKYAASGQGGALTQTPILDNWSMPIYVASAAVGA